ncbi:MAG: hypothetical protein ACOVRP_09340, partial [Gemmatimonas sp.]
EPGGVALGAAALGAAVLGVAEGGAAGAGVAAGGVDWARAAPPRVSASTSASAGKRRRGGPQGAVAAS